MTDKKMAAAIKMLREIGAKRATVRWEDAPIPEDEEFCATGEEGLADAEDDVA